MSHGVRIRYYGEYLLFDSIVTNPLQISGVKEQFLDDFGSYFQFQGFAVLVFDHRSWGDSDGTPRNETRPWTQVEEYTDAITFLHKELSEEVDPSRIAIWGSSFSGGVSLVAGALDPRIKCVIAQVPLTSIQARNAKAPPERRVALFADRAAHTGTDSSSKPPTYIPLFADSLEHAEAGGAKDRILGAVDAWKYYEASNAHHKYLKDEITLQSMYYMPPLEAELYIANISPKPLLMINGKGDNLFESTEVKDIFDKAGEPKEFWEFEGGHFDAYYGPKVKSIMEREVEFMKKYL